VTPLPSLSNSNADLPLQLTAHLNSLLVSTHATDGLDDSNRFHNSSSNSFSSILMNEKKIPVALPLDHNNSPNLSLVQVLHKENNVESTSKSSSSTSSPSIIKNWSFRNDINKIHP